MTEYLLLLISITTVINTIILLKMYRKEIPVGEDTSLYDAQIKNLKRIIRLNEKYIKELKTKGEQKNEKVEQPSNQADLVQINRRVY